MTIVKYGIFPLSILVLSLATTGVLAQETEEDEGMAEVRLLSTPSSSVSTGLGYSHDDLTMLGRYNGRSDNGAYLLLNFDLNQRDAETGTWTLVSGRNVGLSNRNLRYEHNRQGDWNYFIEFDQLDSVNPYQYQTDLSGIGSSQQATGGASSSAQLSQERQNVKMGMGKHFSKEVDFSLSYRHENKEGARNWGQGASYSFGGAFDHSLFMLEPIDYRTQEVEAKLNYTTEALQLQGGYRLSLFDNPTQVVSLDFSSLVVDASPRQTATPPDNQSQILYLNGGYRLSPLTRASFKLVYQQDRQDETFYQSNPYNFRSDLGGKVDTTRFTLGLNSRVTPALTLNARLRYDDRDDNTPKARYLITLGQFNQLSSRTNTDGTLDATYRISPGFSLLAGVEYESLKRDGVDDPNIARRETTDETTLQIGARRNLSDSLKGSIRLSHSQRDSSAWLPGSGVLAGTLQTSPVAFDYVNSIQFADRKRDQLRVALDWYATEQLSLQLVTEASQDAYSGLPLGPRDGSSVMASVDAAYQLSDEWSLSSWVSANQRQLESSSHSWYDLDLSNYLSNYSDSMQTWSGKTIDQGYALGLGLKGQATDEIKVGAKLQYSDDKSKFDMASLVAPVDLQFAPNSSLPTIEYKLTTLTLFGEYALDEQQGLRVDYRYEQIKNNDWSWNNYTDYAGTTVTQLADESNHFIGVSYFYRGW